MPKLLSGLLLGLAGLAGLSVFDPSPTAAFPGTGQQLSGFFKENTLGCRTRSTIRKFLDAEKTGKLDSVAKLLQEDCIRVDGKPYTAIKAGFVATEVRVIDQGITLFLFTPTRDLMR